MNPDSLQTLSVMAIALGFMLIGLGGFTAYHASQQVRHSAEIRALEQKNEADTQILTLVLKNQELQGKIEHPPATPTQQAPAPYRPPSPPPPPISMPETSNPAPGAEPQPPTEPPAPAPPHVTLEAQPSPEASPVEPDLPTRHLSVRQQRLITETLRAHGKHTVTIESSFGDIISHEFAEELAEAFAQADWTVHGIDPHRGLPLESGVTVSAGSFPPQEETRAVYEALLTAGIAVTQQLDPRQRSEETVLLVGSPP